MSNCHLPPDPVLIFWDVHIEKNQTKCNCNNLPALFFFVFIKNPISLVSKKGAQMRVQWMSRKIIEIISQKSLTPQATIQTPSFWPRCNQNTSNFWSSPRCTQLHRPQKKSKISNGVWKFELGTCYQRCHNIQRRAELDESFSKKGTEEAANLCFQVYEQLANKQLQNPLHMVIGVLFLEAKCPKEQEFELMCFEALTQCVITPWQYLSNML